MTAPPEPQTEAAPASSAPPVIHLGPPPDRTAEPKKPKRQRPFVKRTRYSGDELAEFERRAQQSGFSEGAYTRALTIGDAGPRAKRSQPTEESRLKAGHLAALNRIGNLFNQGIKALNIIALETPEAVSRDRLADEVAQARELLEAAIPSLLETLAANREALGYVREG
jgi:hypothetical protein